MTIAPGAAFPSLFLPRVGGGSVHLGASGPALILFFRTDCQASGHAVEAVGRIADALLPRGLVVAAVSQDDEGEAAAFAAVHGLGGALLCTDGSSWLASDAVLLERTPTAFLIDGGQVLATVEGWSRHEFNALAALAAERVGAEAPTASQVGDGLPDHAEPTPARNAGG